MFWKRSKNENKKYNKKLARRSIVQSIVNNDTRILEIGALNSPTFSNKDAIVKYADWLSYDDLVAHYPNKKGILHVDYVIKGSNISGTIGDSESNKFNIIIANHVIEHIPDVIGWLLELSKLTTEGGYVSLAVPDRRYTFDYVRNETDVVDLIDCHRDRLESPSFQQILKHLYFKKNIVSKNIWDGDDITLDLQKKRFSLGDAINRAEKMHGSFHSLHCHVFTINSFTAIINELHEANIIPWKIENIIDVEYYGNEFLALLKKT